MIFQVGYADRGQMYLRYITAPAPSRGGDESKKNPAPGPTCGQTPKLPPNCQHPMDKKGRNENELSPNCQHPMDKLRTKKGVKQSAQKSAIPPPFGERARIFSKNANTPLKRGKIASFPAGKTKAPLRAHSPVGEVVALRWRLVLPAHVRFVSLPFLGEVCPQGIDNMGITRFRFVPFFAHRVLTIWG